MVMVLGGRYISISVKIYMWTLPIVDESGDDADRSGTDANAYDDVSEICGMVFLLW